jgi:hypothetical protein
MSDLRRDILAAITGDVLESGGASVSETPECLAPGWSYEAAVVCYGEGYAAPVVSLVGPGVRKRVALGRALPLTRAHAAQLAGALLEALETLVPGDACALIAADGQGGRKRRFS